MKASTVPFATILMSKVCLRAAHYLQPCVLKRYQKPLVEHRYILHVTPALPKYGAKSSRDANPAPPESIDFRKFTRRHFIIDRQKVPCLALNGPPISNPHVLAHRCRRRQPRRCCQPPAPAGLQPPPPPTLASPQPPPAPEIPAAASPQLVHRSCKFLRIFKKSQ